MSRFFETSAPPPTVWTESPTLTSTLDERQYSATHSIHGQNAQQKFYTPLDYDETNWDGGIEALTDHPFPLSKKSHSVVFTHQVAPVFALRPNDDYYRYIKEFFLKLQEEERITNQKHILYVFDVLAIENISMSNAWRAAIEKVRSFASISTDTDDEGRSAPSTSDMENALDVLETVSQWTDKIPRITPVGDGEITIEWDLKDDGYLDITLYEDLLVYICQTPNGEDVDGEYRYQNKKIIPELEGLIRGYLSDNLPS